MSLRPEDIDRRAVDAYLRSRHGVHAQSNDQDDKTILGVASGDLEYADWAVTEANTDGHPIVKLATESGDPKWCGVVQSTAASSEWCRVQHCGMAMAKVDPGESFTAGDWLMTSSGNAYAIPFEGDGEPCGRFLYYLGASGNGIAMVSIGGGGPSDIQIHHHTSEMNTQWVDKSAGGTPLVGLSHQLFKVNKDQYTGGNDNLMLVLGGHTTHGVATREGMAWGGVIGSNGSTGRGFLGGNEAAIGMQGVLGAEADDTDSQVSGAWRINVRSFAGYNSRDKFAANGKVGPLLYIDSSEPPAYYAPTACRTVTPTTPCAGNGVVWWGGGILWDSQDTPSNNTSWAGHFTPAVPIEIDCCTTYNNPEDPDTPSCEIVTGRANFKSNAIDLNGNYEWVIPYGWTAATGRLDVLSAVCCLNRHVGEIWTVLQRFTNWVGQYAACTDAFFATKADGSGAASTCCDDTPDFIIPLMTCGPTVQNIDCDGNPITG